MLLNSDKLQQEDAFAKAMALLLPMATIPTALLLV
jgi:hypothetical protein